MRPCPCGCGRWMREDEDRPFPPRKPGPAETFMTGKGRDALPKLSDGNIDWSPSSQEVPCP
jgi:hypothetical protein